MKPADNVLVVDDNSVNRMLLRKILHGQYIVTEAENGKQALDLINESDLPFSAIILDLIMPIMDGYEFLEKLRKLPDCGSIPVVVVAEASDNDIELRALKFGANDFLRKPYEPMIIKQRIANIIKLKTLVDNESMQAQSVALINNIPCCIAIYEISDAIKTVYLSEGIFNITGYHATEFNSDYRDNANLFMHHKYRDRLISLLQRCAKSKEPVETEYLCYHKLGEEKWIKLSGKYVSTTENNSVVYYCVLTDITDMKIAQYKLQLNERQLRLAFEQSSLEMVEYDFETDRIMFTPNSRFGKAPLVLNLKNKNLRKIIHEDSIPDLDLAISELRSGKSPIEVNLRIKRHRNFLYYKFSLSTIINENGELSKAIGVCSNINSEIEAHHKYELEAGFRRALTEDAIVFLEIDIGAGVIVSQESDFIKNLDIPSSLSLEKFFQLAIQKTIHPEDVDSLAQFTDLKKLTEEIRTGKSESTFEIRAASPSNLYRGYHWMSISTSFIINPITAHPHMFICARDINDDKLVQLQLMDQAQRDSLTKLYNRTTFTDRVNDYLKSPNKTHELSAFMIIDIDDFKHINDTYGHSLGDEVLTNLSTRLNSLFRGNDIIGRLGGDEFVVFLPDIHNETTAMTKGVSVCKALSFWREKITLTCSVGISLWPKHGTTFEELYENADEALYRSKKLGKNSCCIYEGEISEPLTLKKSEPSQLFNEFDDIIHVIDFETLELLYTNDEGRKAFAITEESFGQPCHKVLYNRDEPCDNCTNDLLDFDKFYVWHHESKLLNSSFLVRNKLIYWNGRIARLEIATDTKQGVDKKSFTSDSCLNDNFNLEKYRFLLSCSSISPFEYDLKTDRLTVINRILQANSIEITLDNFSDYIFNSGKVHPDDAIGLHQCFSQAKPHLSSSQYAFRATEYPDNPMCWYRLNYKHFMLKDNSTFKVVGTIDRLGNRETEIEENPDIVETISDKALSTMLVIDKENDSHHELRAIFSSKYTILTTDTPTSAARLLEAKDNISIVIIVLHSASKVSLKLLKNMQENQHQKYIPVVVILEKANLDDELEAFKLGATEVITRPYNEDILFHRVNKISTSAISDKLTLQRKLSETDERLQSLVNTVPGGIAILAITTTVTPIYFNDSLCSIVGLTRIELESALKSGIRTIIHSQDFDMIRKTVKCAVAEDSDIDCTFRVIHRNGTFPWIHMTATRHRSEKSPVYHAVFIDVTREKESEILREHANEELLYNAIFDKLTKIPNREYFYSLTTSLIRENHEIQHLLLMWDVERFKMINDLFGIDIGDKVLVEIGNHLCNSMPEYATYGRIESDHFAMCVPKHMFNDSFLADAMIKKYEFAGNEVNIVFHVGIYEIEDVNMPIDQICDRATLALQTIKGSYEHRHAFFNESMRDKLLFEQSIASDMAFSLKSGQFFVQLQPIFDTKTKLPIYAEALVRWNHPEKGLLSPGLFIPVFEKNEFIRNIDEFVLEEVCKMLSDSIICGEKVLPISINLSRVSLYNTEIAHTIIDIMDKYSIDTSLIKIEITESAYSESTNQIMEAMNELRVHGFTILMDDFGSGYSSLNMLKDLPVDILKIDMQFIRDLESSVRAEKVVASIINIGKSLGIKVVAEGVETKSQYNFLSAAGCDMIQGYYFSRPISTEQYKQLIENIN